MAMPRSMALDIARGMHEQGKCEFGPNVEFILLIGVELVVNSVPREVRKQLSAAVKAGKLGHLKKEPHKPEAYFHPNSRQEAIHQRNKNYDLVMSASRGAMAINHGDGEGPRVQFTDLDPNR